MKFYRLSGATFYDYVNTIYQFIEPFLDNEMSILRNMELLRLKFRVNKSGLNPTVLFLPTVPRRFFCCSSSLCNCSFIFGVCFVHVYISSLILLVK